MNLIAASSTPVMLCLQEGETVEFSECHPEMEDRTCDNEYGCKYCVYKKSFNKYCPLVINKCNEINPPCTYLDDPPEETEEPPIEVQNKTQNDSGQNQEPESPTENDDDDDDSSSNRNRNNDKGYSFIPSNSNPSNEQKTTGSETISSLENSKTTGQNILLVLMLSFLVIEIFAAFPLLMKLKNKKGKKRKKRK